MLITLFQYVGQISIVTMEWADLMHRIRDGYWREAVERCRKEVLGSDELRKRLPAFGASVTFLDGDEAANVVKYNHIVAIDFDKVLSSDKDPGLRIAECREICAAMPSVVGFYVTKGGRGFRVFVNVGTGIAEHKRIYHPLQEYFEDKLGMQANDRYKDLTRLSFVSYDPDCFYRNIEDAPEFDISAVFPNTNMLHDTTRMSGMAQIVMGELLSVYELRYNITEGALQLRVRLDTANAVSGGHEWHDMDDSLSDRLVTDLNSNGLRVTYNQFQWIMCNYRMPHYYDVVDDFDSHLPEWDGHDYVGGLIGKLNVKDARFDSCARQWLAAMYRAWFGQGTNTRVMALYSDVGETGMTDWVLGLLPPQMSRYMMVTAADFVYGCYSDRRKWLLVVVEDFCGDNWGAVERILSDNQLASVIITARHRLANAPGYVSQFGVDKIKDGSRFAPVRHECLYSQLSCQSV